MKLIDIMKAYNKAILRENAKLKSIYNNLIRESEDLEDECDTNECDTNECDVSEKDDKEDVSEAATDKLMTAEEFFRGVDVSEDDDEEDIKEDGDEEDIKEDDDEEVISEFVSKKNVSETATSDNLLSAAEFFGEVPSKPSKVNESKRLKKANRRLFR